MISALHRLVEMLRAGVNAAPRQIALTLSLILVVSSGAQASTFHPGPVGAPPTTTSAAPRNVADTSTTRLANTRIDATRGEQGSTGAARSLTSLTGRFLAAKGAEEGIYVIQGAGGTYVGQSGITQRFSQHLIQNGGRFTQKELDAAERIPVSGGKTAREIAEQQKIDEFPNGIDDLLNKRNPIGPRRFHVMPAGYSRP
jgi:hypothetical protein